jgi:hypothetical protein
MRLHKWLSRTASLQAASSRKASDRFAARGLVAAPVLPGCSAARVSPGPGVKMLALPHVFEIAHPPPLSLPSPAAGAHWRSTLS